MGHSFSASMGYHTLACVLSLVGMESCASFGLNPPPWGFLQPLPHFRSAAFLPVCYTELLSCWGNARWHTALACLRLPWTASSYSPSL